MLLLAPTSKLLTTMAENTVTLANIVIRFPTRLPTRPACSAEHIQARWTSRSSGHHSSQLPFLSLRQSRRDICTGSLVLRPLAGEQVEP